MSAISSIKVTRVRVIAHDRLGRDRSSQSCSNPGECTAPLCGWTFGA